MASTPAVYGRLAANPIRKSLREGVLSIAGVDIVGTGASPPPDKACDKAKKKLKKAKKKVKKAKKSGNRQEDQEGQEEAEEGQEAEEEGVLSIVPTGTDWLGCQRCEAQIEFPDLYPAGWLGPSRLGGRRAVVVVPWLPADRRAADHGRPSRRLGHSVLTCGFPPTPALQYRPRLSLH